MANGAAQRFQNLFFSSRTITNGSVTEYYADVSGGKIALSGEVKGPFRMPLKLSEYANGANGLGGAFPNIRTLAADALTAVTGQINFAPYDNDGNGYVDAFVVVHAGMGGEVTGNKSDIWSAKWVLPNEVSVNNVKVYGFLTIPEDAFIGVCAHELGHLLFGWPDLYDTDYSSQGIGNWCLMSGGAWGGSPPGTKPVNPSAWCKKNQGWVDVVTENQNKRITLVDVKASHEVHKLWKNGDPASQEYFLIENRELTGFDQFLPGPGLLGIVSFCP
jgi:immune inhibitor A